MNAGAIDTVDVIEVCIFIADAVSDSVETFTVLDGVIADIDGIKGNVLTGVVRMNFMVLFVRVLGIIRDVNGEIEVSGDSISFVEFTKTDFAFETV